MGNCCGSQSKNFQGEGHTVASSIPPPRPVQQAPQTHASPQATRTPPRVTGPGRTLGASGSGEDPRSAAARAAEARANKPQGSGPLAAKLAAQKKAGMQGALRDAANENRRARESDALAETRNYN